MTIVSATSFTERPVCRYLFTCLQFTAPAKLAPAEPSNIATPINSVPRLMPEPPCAYAQLLVSPTRLAKSGRLYTNASPAREVTGLQRAADDMAESCASGGRVRLDTRPGAGVDGRDVDAGG